MERVFLNPEQPNVPDGFVFPADEAPRKRT
jgi:hypothetical protein